MKKNLFVIVALFLFFESALHTQALAREERGNSGRSGGGRVSTPPRSSSGNGGSSSNVGRGRSQGPGGSGNVGRSTPRPSQPPRDGNVGRPSPRPSQPPRDGNVGRPSPRPSQPPRDGNVGRPSPRPSQPPRDGNVGRPSPRPSQPPRDGNVGRPSPRPSQPPRDGNVGRPSPRPSQPPRDGNVGRPSPRPSQPPRDGNVNRHNRRADVRVSPIGRLGNHRPRNSDRVVVAHRNYGHRPAWNRRDQRYSRYTHGPYRDHQTHRVRYKAPRHYHYTIPYKYVYWNHWVRVKINRNDGYYFYNGYPYYVYNGYMHRYSHYDPCSYELVDGWSNETVKEYEGYNCSSAYDMCADDRDDWNADEREYRYFCSEPFDYDPRYSYDWDEDQDFYSDIVDDTIRPWYET